MKHIPEEHLKQLAEHGYTVVEDFLSPEELAAVQKELAGMFPSRDVYDYARTVYQTEIGVRHLPYLGDLLNSITVSPELVSFAERVLGTKRIGLVTSHVWAKYAGSGEYGQALHADYRSGSLLYPNRRGRFEEAITFIIYYADVDEQLGPTCVVSERHSKDQLLVPDIRYEHDSPELYRHERPLHVRAGSLLAYNMTVFHRGSALTSQDRVRYTHHITYQSNDSWMGVSVWAPYSFAPELGDFIGRASPRERELFGFPPPGDEYWNEETLAGVAARYPLMDMTPYVAAADIPQKQKTRLRRELKLPRTDKTGTSASASLDAAPTEESGRAAPDFAHDYCRGVADYCAAVTGVPAGYWLPWLLAYQRQSTPKQFNPPVSRRRLR